MDAPERLGAGEVHVWHLDPDVSLDPDEFALCLSLLTPAERERYDRFKVERARREYLMTRALQRGVLSLYSDVAPGDWRFDLSEQGKPGISMPAGHGSLRFNLSNTYGLVVCAVTLGCEIGVDVEDMRRRGETVKLADRYFSTAEVSTLHALPERCQRRRFFEYWTLKEAYIKARGLGLTVPLAEYSFDLRDPELIRVSFEGSLAAEDESGRWRFWQQDLSDRHVAALAICAPVPGPGTLFVHVRPFSSRGDLSTLLTR